MGMIWLSYRVYVCKGAWHQKKRTSQGSAWPFWRRCFGSILSSWTNSSWEACSWSVSMICDLTQKNVEKWIAINRLKRIMANVMISSLETRQKMHEELKVQMTWKIISAYLKGLSKYRRMAFFFLKYIFSF